MITGKKFFMKVRNIHLGPGGWHCPCCVPAKKARKSWIRKSKRREAALVRKIVTED